VLLTAIQSHLLGTQTASVAITAGDTAASDAVAIDTAAAAATAAAATLTATALSATSAAAAATATAAAAAEKHLLEVIDGVETRTQIAEGVGAASSCHVFLYVYCSFQSALNYTLIHDFASLPLLYFTLQDADSVLEGEMWRSEGLSLLHTLLHTDYT
jgi:hypothetical protein